MQGTRQVRGRVSGQVGRGLLLLVAGLLSLPGCKGTKHSTDANKRPTNANVTRREDFGRTKDGQAVELYTLTNSKGMVAKVMTYGATLTELHVPDRNGQTGRRRPRLQRPRQVPGRPPVLRRHRRAASPTGSARADSRSTARSTSSPSTTAPTACTAGKVVRQGRLEGQAGRTPPAGPSRQAAPTSARTAKRAIPATSTATRHLHAHEQRRAADRLHGHDRQADAGQPDQPQLLQPGRRRPRDDPRPRS